MNTLNESVVESANADKPPPDLDETLRDDKASERESSGSSNDSDSSSSSGSSGDSSSDSGSESSRSDSEEVETSGGVVVPVVKHRPDPLPEAELEDLGLNVSTESYKSADVTLTRKLESELIGLPSDNEVINENLECNLLNEQCKGASLDLAEVKPVAVAQVEVGSVVSAVAVKDLVPKAVVVDVLVPEIAVIATPTVPPVNPVIKVTQSEQPEQQCISNVAPPSANVVFPENQMEVADSTKIKRKDKKDKRVAKKKAHRQRKQAARAQSKDGQCTLDEGNLLVKMVASFLSSNDGRSKGSPRRKRHKKRSSKSHKSVKAKKSKYTESRSESDSESSNSSPESCKQPPASTNRIARLSMGKKFLHQAMARAKYAGLSLDDNARLAELTKALKIANEMEFIVHPSLAYPDFNNVLGTGLPHIQTYVKEFSDKYGPIVKDTVILNLTLEKNKILSKASLIGPEASNPFVSIWQFKNALQRAVPSALSPMETSSLASTSNEAVRSRYGSSTSDVAIDFNQLPDGPSTSKSATSIKRSHKSSASSSSKLVETPEAPRKRSDKGKEHKSSRKKHKSKKSEIVICNIDLDTANILRSWIHCNSISSSCNIVINALHVPDSEDGFKSLQSVLEVMVEVTKVEVLNIFLPLHCVSQRLSSHNANSSFDQCVQSIQAEVKHVIINGSQSTSITVVYQDIHKWLFVRALYLVELKIKPDEVITVINNIAQLKDNKHLFLTRNDLSNEDYETICDILPQGDFNGAWIGVQPKTDLTDNCVERLIDLMIRASNYKKRNILYIRFNGVHNFVKSARLLQHLLNRINIITERIPIRTLCIQLDDCDLQKKHCEIILDLMSQCKRLPNQFILVLRLNEFTVEDGNDLERKLKDLFKDKTVLLCQ